MASKKKTKKDDETSKPVTESGMALTRDLLVRLSDSEIAMKARAREEVEEKKSEIEREKKQAIDDFNARIEECDDEIDRLREIVRTGFERRPITCVGERDPEHGRIVFVRPDSGEVVDWRPMTTAEKQLVVGDTAKPATPRVIHGTCDACGVVTPSGEAPRHHGDCPKVKPLEPVAEPLPETSPDLHLHPDPSPACTCTRNGPELAIDPKCAEHGHMHSSARPTEPAPEDTDPELEGDVPGELPADPVSGDDELPNGVFPDDLALEERDELAEELEQPSAISPAIGFEVVDVTGASRVVGQSVADALRSANRVGRPMIAEDGVELSHVKGEPVRVRVQGGRIFDLLPSEVAGLRRALASGKAKDVQITRAGKTWPFVEIAKPIEDRDDGAEVLEKLGDELPPPPPSDKPEPEKPSKKGAKKGAKKS